MFTCATQTKNKNKREYTSNRCRDWQFILKIDWRKTERRLENGNKWEKLSFIVSDAIWTGSYQNGLWQQKVMLPQTCCLGLNCYLQVTSRIWGGISWERGRAVTRRSTDSVSAVFCIGTKPHGGMQLSNSKYTPFFFKVEMCNSTILLHTSE